MSDQIEKLKNSIKKDYTKLFEINLMKSSGFIPVDKRQKNFYVILQQGVTKKDEIEKIIKSKIPDLLPQFIPVSSQDFSSLLDYITQGETQTVVNENIDVSELSAEDMLVSIGWLTKQQLTECLAESEAKKVPLDVIFYEKEYLTYERIVSYLKKKSPELHSSEDFF